MDIMERVEMLLDSGIDVMIHGRTDDSCDRAGTMRWFIEIENYPVCISAQGEELNVTLDEAIESYFTAMEAHADA